MTFHPLLNEHELLAGIASGNESDFKIIYDHYRPLVYSFSVKYLKSSEEAEEIVQEIFLKLWRLGEQLRKIDNLENYILTMSRNRSLDILRRRKFKPEALPDDIEGYDNATEERIILRDTKRVLEEAIALLPPQQKLVYTLCHVDGRKQDEVAKQLKLSPETVKRHMKLALKFIRSYVSSHTDTIIILIILKLV